MEQHLTFIGGGNIALAIYGGLLEAGYPSHELPSRIPVPSKVRSPQKWASPGKRITNPQSEMRILS